jgi:hypothetical protein
MNSEMGCTEPDRMGDLSPLAMRRMYCFKSSYIAMGTLAVGTESGTVGGAGEATFRKVLGAAVAGEDVRQHPLLNGVHVSGHLLDGLEHLCRHVLRRRRVGWALGAAPLFGTSSVISAIVDIYASKHKLSTLARLER